jgi:chromosome segregation ATPase
MSPDPGTNTAAALAARRRQTQDKLTRVENAIGQLRRERGRLSVRTIAQRADVSTTFLYQNTEARARVRNAIADSRSHHDRATRDEHDRVEATWRERALNAEAELTRTQKEVHTQRRRIGELMGQIRDTDQMVPGDSVQKLTTENTTLKRRVQQLTQEHRSLQERLEGARSNLRFADRRIADLQAQLLELQQATPATTTPPR